MRVPPFEFAIRREEKIAVGLSTSIPSSVLGSFTFEEKRLDGSWTRLGASSGVERRVYDYNMTGCCLPLKPHKNMHDDLLSRSWPTLRVCLPFRSARLPYPLCVHRNLAIDDDGIDDDDNVSVYVVASPTSRFALVFTMPTRPCMYNAFLVLSENIMRNGRERKYQVWRRWEMSTRKKREKGGNATR